MTPQGTESSRHLAGSSLVALRRGPPSFAQYGGRVGTLRVAATLIAHAPDRRLDGQAIGDEGVAVEFFQNFAAGGTMVFAPGRGRGRQLKPPKSGSARGASHIAFFHWSC